MVYEDGFSDLTATLQSTTHSTQPALFVKLNILAKGIVRLTIDEQKSLRYRVRDKIDR